MWGLSRVRVAPGAAYPRVPRAWSRHTPRRRPRCAAQPGRQVATPRCRVVAGRPHGAPCALVRPEERRRASDRAIAGQRPFGAGGGWGIRTPEGLHPTRFPSVRHRPLGESSWERRLAADFRDSRIPDGHHGLDHRSRSRGSALGHRETPRACGTTRPVPVAHEPTLTRRWKRVGGRWARRWTGRTVHRRRLSGDGRGVVCPPARHDVARATLLWTSRVHAALTGRLEWWPTPRAASSCRTPPGPEGSKGR
jgi:hypothetical protein